MASNATESTNNAGGSEREETCGCSEAVVEQISSISLKERSETNTDKDPNSSDADPSKESSSKGDDNDDEVALNKAPTSAWTCLEEYKRFSESILWSFMMNFYDKKGVESWSKGIVPYFITSNAHIGRTYAKLLQGFLCDLSKGGGSWVELDRNEKLYIVELGAGAGKFSFFMLKALWELKNVIDFPVQNITYVLTDFTESNVNFWKGHHALKPFVESGQLDFAIFDASNDDHITLINSGVTLSQDNPTENPIFVVANYIFDTLCHDVFHVDAGVLKEGLVAVGTSKEGEPDLRDPDIIETINNKYKYVPTDVDYYADIERNVDAPHFKSMLTWYKSYFTDNDPNELGASVLIPIGSIRALRNISDASKAGTVILAGDKANCHPNAFRGLVDPHFAIHGSFSVMANFHAIGVYCTSRGGFYMHNQAEEASLQVSCFVIPPTDGRKSDGDDVVDFLKDEGLAKVAGERASEFPLFVQAFNDNVDSFGPSDFFALQRCVKEETPNPSLGNIVALLRLSNWDPDIYFKFRDQILAQVASASCKLRNDLIKGMPRIWDNYFELDKEKDVAFEIGRFYYGCLKYGEALKYYGLSSDTLGEHHVTFHNMGLCHYSMGNLETALGYFKKALALKSTYEKAASWIEKVSKEIGGDESKKQN